MLFVMFKYLYGKPERSEVAGGVSIVAPAGVYRGEGVRGRGGEHAQREDGEGTQILIKL